MKRNECSQNKSSSTLRKQTDATQEYVKAGLGKDPNTFEGAANTARHGPNLGRFVQGSSPGERIGFTPHAIHSVDGSKRRFWANTGGRERKKSRPSRQLDKRREGRNSGARPLPTRSGRKRGLAPRPGSRPARPRPEGRGRTTTGGAEAVAVGGAVYILHLRESTPRSGTIHRERRLEGDFR